jgi:hypothetical protein
MTLLRLQALLMLAGAASLPGAARAEDLGPIRDEAGFFSKGAIEKALEGINDIRATYHRDLVVRTIPELTPEQREEFRTLRTRQINRKLVAYAREWAAANGVNGVLIEICRNPPYVLVVVWPAEEERVFTASDCEAVRRKLARGLRDPDAALLDAVGQVGTILHNNMAHVPLLSTNLVFVGGLLAALLAAWLLLLALRRGGAGAAADPPALAAARWYTRLGTPAGAWLADKVFRAYRAPAPPAAERLAEAPPRADVNAPDESVPEELPQA